MEQQEINKEVDEATMRYIKLLYGTPMLYAPKYPRFIHPSSSPASLGKMQLVEETKPQIVDKTRKQKFKEKLNTLYISFLKHTKQAIIWLTTR